MARIRLEGSTAANVPTPPAGKATIFYDTDLSAMRAKFSDGNIVPLTVTDEYLQDLMGSTLVSDGTTTVTYDDVGNTISISVIQTALDHTQFQNIGTNSHAAIDSHIASTSNPHNVTKTQVGLSNVDNTSDVNKPVSTAQAAADSAVQAYAIQRANHTGTQLSSTISDFNAAADSRISAARGATNGIAPLDGAGLVPASYLPSFVDDVLEYANLASFPVTGATGIIYVALDTEKIYRWSGAVYIEISPSPGSTDDVPEGAINKYFTENRVLNTILAGLSTATNAVISAADSVLSALGKLQAQITAHFGIGGSTHPAATTSVNGFMSASDKLKLDHWVYGFLAYSNNSLQTTTQSNTGYAIITLDSDKDSFANGLLTKTSATQFRTDFDGYVQISVKALVQNTSNNDRPARFAVHKNGAALNRTEIRCASKTNTDRYTSCSGTWEIPCANGDQFTLGWSNGEAGTDTITALAQSVIMTVKAEYKS